MGNGKVVLVTGSSSGFGKLGAEELARNGHRVFASMRASTARNAESRRALESLAASENLSLDVVDLDVTDDGSVAKAIAAIVRQAGRIDVLINNAGVMTGHGAAESFAIEQIEGMFAVNVFGAMRVTRAALPHMRGGDDALIVWISSGLGRVVVPTLGLYSTSKYALEALAETYRYELADQGIDSVVVQPGAYTTNMSVSHIAPADPGRLEHYGPLMRAAERTREMFRQGRESKDPRDVAVAVAGLVDMAPGTRPLRSRVGGEGLPIDPLNETSERIQRDLLQRLGLAGVAFRGRPRRGSP